MSNTLTGIIPTLYEALNVVSREMVGFVPAVRRDTNADRAAKGQTVRVPLGESGSLEDITPGETPANSGDTTVDYADVVIENSKAAPIRWNGEEELAVGTTGTYNRILADQFADGMRKLVNAVEEDIREKVRASATLAYGNVATTPFATAGNLLEAAKVAEILDNNGAPITDRQLVVGSAAMANLRGIQSIRLADVGQDQLLRSGLTDIPLNGFALRYSGAIKSVGNAAAASYVTDGAQAAGALGVKVKTGTANIKAGDLFTVADDPFGGLYVAASDHDGDGTFAIHRPGLREALATGKALTFKGKYVPCAAFNRSAIVLASRAPALPTGGDSADDSMFLTDPVSGLTFEVRVYRQYRQVKYEVGLAWGAAVVKPEHVALLAGGAA